MPKGQPATLTFNYDGRLTGTEDSPIYGIKFAAIQNDYAFLLYPARWFPVSGYTSDRFTSKINVTGVPQGLHGCGRSADFTKPSFPGDIAIFKGPAGKELDRRFDHDPVVPRRRSGHGQRLGAATAQMVGYFTGLYGLAPSANLTVIETADGSPNGYAAPGMIFLSPPRSAKK